jgi:sec-independent protein translocase protein TatB
MFDFSWSEIGLVVVVAVVVIGPEELPTVMRTLGRIARRLQYVRYAFSQQFEDFMRENDLDDIRRQVNFEEKNFDELRSDEDEEELHQPPPVKKVSDDNA